MIRISLLIPALDPGILELGAAVADPQHFTRQQTKKVHPQDRGRLEAPEPPA